MENLRKYRRNLIKLFIISVKKDMGAWQKCWSDEYKSISYNDVEFVIDIKKKSLYFVDKNGSNSRILLSHFSIGIIPLNFRIWYCYKKLKKNFKLIDNEHKKMVENRDYNEKVTNFKNAFNNAQEIFKKEIRKEKLNKLS